MIKIDTEGSEYLVLTGAERFFSESDIECSLIEISSGERFGNTPHEIYEKMKQFGFLYCYGFPNGKIKPVSNHMDSKIFLGNVLFTKRELKLILRG